MSRRSSRLSASLSDPSSSLNVGTCNVGTLNREKFLSTDAAGTRPPSFTASNGKDASNSIPYFEEWSTDALQAEVKRYGFKVSRKRSTLIDQLKAVYEALHRSNADFETPTVPSVPNVSTEPAQVSRTKRKLVLPASKPGREGVALGSGKGRGRQSDPFVLDGDSMSDASSSSDSVILASNEVDEGEAGDYTAQLEMEALSATDGTDSNISLSTSASPDKPRRGRPPRSWSSSSSSDIPLSTFTTAGEEQEQAVEPTVVLAETMTHAIRSNAGVWSRVLRYEPISFDEFVSIATQNGLEMDTGKRKEELRTWLDRQCICFYSNDLTGPRSRH
ncbi:hypothetical protein EX895_002887 [Sporisorium graminicola]|uniref:Structure-specific endonuclease subunit SLX4 n=1 Tax=Sporisorium graminicola TaxID=280036 RepID=A0A4U7KVL0_9BASI|nr:hypothetical protein EX895_002887 [Sporisorium graminicola]TKY88177.1 hypothetical protein EX895_002887 [Sporisorium graminicola]